MEQVTRKRGRPAGKVTPEQRALVVSETAKGRPMVAIADELGIGRRDLYRDMERFPDEYNKQASQMAGKVVHGANVVLDSMLALIPQLTQACEAGDYNALLLLSKNLDTLLRASERTDRFRAPEASRVEVLSRWMRENNITIEQLKDIIRTGDIPDNISTDQYRTLANLFSITPPDGSDGAAAMQKPKPGEEEGAPLDGPVIDVEPIHPEEDADAPQETTP